MAEGNSGTLLPLNAQDNSNFSPFRWMACPTFGIEQFFDILKQKWLRLEWMPHSNSGKDVWETDEDPDRNDLAMRKIMLDCGWPGDGKGGKWKRQQAQELIDELYDRIQDTD